MRSIVTAALLSCSAVAQVWVPIGPDTAAGVMAAAQPLPPLVLTPTVLAPVAVREFVGDAFVANPTPLPAELDDLQAAAYDRVGQRLVVYSAELPSFGGGGGGTSAIGVFDGARWSVLSTVNTPPPRLRPSFAFDAQRGSIVMFGGRVSGFPSGTAIGDMWELIGDTWQQLAVATPPARSDAPLVGEPGGGLMLFGGFGVGFLADTWVWNGTTWSQQSPVTSPAARQGHAMGFDAATGRTLLYGGTSIATAPPFADAWQWDGLDWSSLPAPQAATLIAPRFAHDGQRLLLFGRDGATTGPVAVFAATAGSWQVVHRDPPLPDVFLPSVALDEVRHELVRFGGRELHGTTHLDDTWVWNLGWQLRTPAVRPPARRAAAMAFDPARAVTVLFGGIDANNLFGDTWEWDGSTWTQANPISSPSPRLHAAMTFDPLRGKLVLHGGSEANGYANDTWQWDGVDWAPVASAAVPPGASAVSLAFDVARQVLALYVAPAGQPGLLHEFGPTGWQLVNGNGPLYGPIAYDPGTGTLAVTGPGGPAGYVGGVWVPRSLPSAAFVVSDFARGGLLSAPSSGPLVRLATAQPAAAAAIGTGCGPLGEVTLGANRAPALGAQVALRVRTLAGGTPTFLFFGTFAHVVPLGGGCTSYVGGPIVGYGQLAPPSGHAEFGLLVPSSMALLGAELFAQPVTLHAGGLGFGNGLQLRVGW